MERVPTFEEASDLPKCPSKDFRLLLFNKPMDVLTRFTDQSDRQTLAHFIPVSGVYPIGRLDRDSEGLLLLTDRGSLVDPLLRPGAKSKTYLVCVEGIPSSEQIELLAAGPVLKDGPTLPCSVSFLEAPPAWLWERSPPIRFRKSIPVSWLQVTLKEGRNRQVRRMTAAVGLPTLRLVRLGFGPFKLGPDLAPGAWREASGQEKKQALAAEASVPSKKSKKKSGKRR